MVLSVADFAKKIRKESGAYQGVDDLTLAKAVVKQRPEYASQVKIPTEYTGGTMFSPAAVKGFTNAVDKKVQKAKALFNQGQQIAQTQESKLQAMQPTAEQVGIRRDPRTIKDAISNWFKSNSGGNRDIETAGQLAGSIGEAGQTALNFLGGGTWDLATGLGNIRKQIEQEGYMKTGADMYEGVKQFLPEAIETGKGVLSGEEAAIDKMMRFAQKYPDVVVGGFQGLSSFGKALKNAPKNLKTARTLIENPSANIVDDMGRPTGETVTARQMATEFVKNKFERGADSFLAQSGPSPYAVRGNAQAQGRRYRPGTDPTAGQGGPTTQQGPGGQGINFQDAQVVDGINVPKGAPTNYKNTVWGKAVDAGQYIGDKVGAVVDFFASPLAQIITKNKTASQKLYSAISPRFNKLAGKNNQQVQKIEKNMNTINKAIVAMQMKPETIGDYVDSVNEVIAQMGKKVSEKIGKDLTIDMGYVADRIQAYVDQKRKSGIITDKPGLDKLLEQADEYRQMGEVSPAVANIIKQELNERANRADKDLAKITQNGFTAASVALGDALSTVLSEIPGEFRFYKETMGAGLSVLEDLFKSAIQRKRKSSEGVVKSFSRIQGLKDILLGIGGQSPSMIGGGFGTLVLGEAYGRLSDKDVMVKEGFDLLYQELGMEVPKNVYKPATPDVGEKQDFGITDQQIMKDYAGGKRYGDFRSAKQATADAEAKAKQEALAKQERLNKRAEEAQKIKKEKIETQKRRFDAAIKSGQYEEIEIGRQPPRKGDLTEFYGEIESTVVDRGNIRINAEDATDMTIYEVGKIARRKWEKPADSKTPVQPDTDNGGDGTGPIDEIDTGVKVRGYKQAEYKTAAEDMIGTSIESLSPEGRALFQKAINATKTENRLKLIDELLFNYGTTEAKSAYLLDIAEKGSKADIQEALDNVIKYGLGKENQYTPDEHTMTISYLKDLLGKTQDMDQPSLFSIPQDEGKATQGAPTEKLQDTTEIRSDKKPVDADTTASDQRDGGGGDKQLSKGGGESDGGGLVATIKRQGNKSVIGRFTNSLLSVIETNGGMKDGYLKVELDSDAMMPFVVEEIGNNQIAVSHYYLQNGDVMYDPEVIFNVKPDGSLDAVSIMNSYFGRALPIKNSDSFLDTWARNLEMYIKAPGKKVDQGFEDFKKEMEEREAKQDTGEYKKPVVSKDTTFYHATNKEFKEFSLGKAGENTERDNARFGIFFSDDLKAVKDFARENVGQNPIIKEVKLDIKNPIDFTIQGIFNNAEQAPTILKMLGYDEDLTPTEALEIINDEIDFTNIDELFEGIFSDIDNKKIMVDAGYDGMIAQFGKGENNSVIREYAVFDPKQITIKTQDSSPLLSPETKTLSKQKKDDIQKTAVEILEKKNYSMDAADYTTEEIQLFKTYSGVSGLTAEAGILDQFYTPSTVIKAMRNLVGKHHNGPVQLALEPAAGIGRIALVGPEGIKYDMFEIDKTAGTIAQILNQDSNVTIGDFQDLFMDGRKPKQTYEGKFYDIAISNPPYKARQTKQRGLGELQDFDRFEDYFTYRQLQMIKPGGVVVTIVPSAFLDKGLSKAKVAIAGIGKLVEAYRLPEGTFPDTQVGTDILVFKKEPGSIDDLLDKNYFKKNPDKILGEEKPGTDRFGKEITKVVGEKNAVTKIQGEFPKTIKNYKTTPTITNPQGTLFAPATPNSSPVKKAETNKPILTKEKGKFETQTIVMGNQDPKILQYQKDTDVLGHLMGYTIDDIAKDPNGLNYMNGKIYSNYHYLQGNIREKLDALEKDMIAGSIDKDIYNRQKSKLKAILPADVSMMDIMFSPFDQAMINMPTGETKSGWEYQDGKQVKVQVPVTIRDLFMRWLRDNKPTSIESDNYQISRILDGKVAKGDAEIKYQIQIDAQKAFNDFMVEALPSELQEKILLDYNYSYNSYVKPDNKSQPLVVNDVSTSFKGGKFKFTDAQIEGINHLTNKGAGMIAYGVGVGKTITGLGATVVAMQKGWTKRPLFVVPKATLQHTWIGTIKELFPNYNIVNLGGLGVPDIKRLTKEYGPNPSDWIKDGDIAITTFQGLKNITLKPENEALVTKDLTDVMGKQTDTAKQAQKLNEKIDMEAGKLLKTTGSEIYLEDLGIDHLTIDEVHNAKNIFQSAEVNKEEGEFNPFSAVLKGSSSDLGRKAYMVAQHVMRNNNNRGVYTLSATPFNNQPIEVYNLLALMAKKRLEQMGIKNINDFFTTFSYIQEEEVISPKDFGTVEYRPTMKSFANVQELQKLITEFIDYKDAATAITMQQRPDKVVAKHIVKNSPLQETVNQRIREWTEENSSKKGVYLVGMGQSILNATSPYFVNQGYSGISPATNGKQLFDASPKLQMALSMTDATLKSGKGHIFWFLEQGVEYHPMIVQHIQETLGLKKGEVAYISGKITQDKKDDIAEGFRQGKIKVLIGGTTTAEGIDLQKHGITTLFFSLNWNPTKTVQAGGRVRRPGNPRDKVYEAYLLSEDSGDLWLMQKYEEKASRINDIFSYQGRVFEDEAMTDGQAKMALMTNPMAKAKQQMEMDRGEIVKKSKRMFDLTERNSQKIKLLNEETRSIGHVEKYVSDLEESLRNGTIREYQKGQLEDYRKELARSKNKVRDIIKKHDKDYSNLPMNEAAEKIMVDLNEKNRSLFEEKNKLDEEAKNIEQKLPEYEKYFFEEQKRIDALKKTSEEQVEQYKEFLKSVKVI